MATETSIPADTSAANPPGQPAANPNDQPVPTPPTSPTTTSLASPRSPQKSKRAGPATPSEKYGYYHPVNWSKALIKESDEIQKKKKPLQGTLQPEIVAAWERGDVSAFDGMMAKYRGSWQWCCQKCYDWEEIMIMTPTNYNTFDYDVKKEAGTWWNAISIDSIYLCRHVFNPPNAPGNLGKSCGPCRGQPGGCVTVPREIRTLYQEHLPVRQRVRAGLIVLKVDKMSTGTRSNVAVEIQRLLTYMVYPALNTLTEVTVEQERAKIDKAIEDAKASYQANNPDSNVPFDAASSARKIIYDWTGGVPDADTADVQADVVVDSDGEVEEAKKQREAEHQAEEARLDEVQMALDIAELERKQREVSEKLKKVRAARGTAE